MGQPVTILWSSSCFFLLPVHSLDATQHNNLASARLSDGPRFPLVQHTGCQTNPVLGKVIMRTQSIAAACLSLLALAACNRLPEVDLEAERDALLEADRAWSSMALEQQIAQLADDAIYMVDGAPTLLGKRAIAASWRVESMLPGFSIDWTPERAEVSVGGDLGWTFGSNEISLENAKGELLTTLGTYVSVWRKDGSGSWKIVADITSSNG